MSGEIKEFESGLAATEAEFDKMWRVVELRSQGECDRGCSGAVGRSVRESDRRKDVLLNFAEDACGYRRERMEP